MANTASKIIVGSNGRILVAAVGATAPTNATSALNASWAPLGFIAESGAQVSIGMSVTDVMAWQSFYTVRKIVTSRSLEVSFTMREFNADALVFALGGGTLSVSGGNYTYTPPAPEELDTRAFVLEWSDDTKDYRLYIPEGMVQDQVQFSVSRENPTELPVSFSAIGSGTADIYTLFSDDPGLGSSS